MAQPYVGEIRMFAGNFAPVGWAFCNGQLLSIGENDALFNLIGTTYGGDGEQTFAVPDLQGRVPTHEGTSGGTTYVMGESGGVEAVTLTTAQIPAHTHTLFATANTASTTAPTGTSTLAAANVSTITPYGADNPSVTMHGSSVSSVGGSQPHDNMQPYLCIHFIISLFGVFPTPT